VLSPRDKSVVNAARTNCLRGICFLGAPGKLCAVEPGQSICFTATGCGQSFEAQGMLQQSTS
jgi:hypothetical protein